MVVRVDSGDEARIAYAAGYSGKPAPDGLSAGALGAHRLGMDDHDNGRAKAPNGDIEKAAHTAELAERQERKNIANDKPKKAPAKKAAPPVASGSRKPKRVRDQLPGGQQVAGKFTGNSNWGDGGGLLMAVFLYPIALAMLTRGPTGLTAWLNAKFFNKVATAAGKGPGPNGGNVLAPGALPPGVTITPPAPPTGHTI